MRTQKKASLALAFLAVLAYAATAQALPTMTVGSASGAAGTAVNVPFTFDPSTNSVAGIQFTITLPASLSTGTVTPGAILNTAVKQVNTNLIGSNWTFVVFGVNLNTISSGILLTAQMLIAPGTPLGSLSLPISNIIYSDANGNAVPTGSSTNGTVTVVPPAPVITSSATATGQVGVALSYQITASNSPTSFNATGLPGGLSVDTATGLISGIPTASGSFSVGLSATNTGGTGNATLSLTILPPPPVVTSTGTATGQVGVAFSYQITATNNPTSFGATGLPAGLSVNTGTGLISGTPTSSGTFNVGLSAINAGGTGSATLTLTILPPAPVITNPNTASGKQWSNFLYQIVATHNPTSYNALGLPTGLSINGATGQIAGAPQGAGTSIVTLAATNSGGTGNLQLTLTVLPVCDVNSDGKIDILDVQLEVNMALGFTPCTSDINRDGLCNVLDIQRIVNAALGGACVSP